MARDELSGSDGRPNPNARAGLRGRDDIEERQIGWLARFEAPRRQVKKTRRVARHHPDRGGQIDLRIIDHASDAHTERLRSPGQELELAGNDQSAIVEDFDFAPHGDWSVFRPVRLAGAQFIGRKHGPVPFTRHVSTRRLAGLPREITDEHAPLGRLGAYERLDDRWRQVLPVGNQARAKPVFGELIPEVIGMAAHTQVCTVAQMGAEPRPASTARRICSESAAV